MTNHHMMNQSYNKKAESIMNHDQNQSQLNSPTYLISIIMNFLCSVIPILSLWIHTFNRNNMINHHLELHMCNLTHMSTRTRVLELREYKFHHHSVHLHHHHLNKLYYYQHHYHHFELFIKL